MADETIAQMFPQSALAAYLSAELCLQQARTPGFGQDFYELRVKAVKALAEQQALIKRIEALEK